MAKKTLTVTTDCGTFTRTTARDYTHIVVCHHAPSSYWAERGHVFGVLGWCGSLALAMAQVRTWGRQVGKVDGFTELRIYTVTGERIQ
jgi:hypothetical protein